MKLEHVAGATALETFDQRRFPGRARLVERRHRQVLCEIEQLAFRAGLRQAHATQVVIEIEVRILDPDRVADAEARIDDTLAKTRHRFGHPTMTGDEAFPVRRGVHHQHRGRRRAQTRIDFRAPHHGLERAHLGRAAPVAQYGEEVFVHRFGFAHLLSALEERLTQRRKGKKKGRKGKEKREKRSIDG